MIATPLTTQIDDISHLRTLRQETRLGFLVRDQQWLSREGLSHDAQRTSVTHSHQ